MNEDSYFFRTETDLVALEARRQKAERTKNVGSPVELPGKPLAIRLRGNDLWVAQSDAVIRRIDLETGAIQQVYRGHTAPVTTLSITEDPSDPRAPPFLISGSWDKTVKIWDTKSKNVLSSTEAHSDFLKCVFPIPGLKLLATSGADKVVRLWDISDLRSTTPLKLLGLISAHSRPVQCIAVDVHSPSEATLITGDSMGIIKVWSLERSYGDSPSCRAAEKQEVSIHRTGINDLWFANGELWTASSDDTALLTHVRSENTLSSSSSSSSAPSPKPIRPIPPLTHPTSVKALLPLSLTPLGESLLLTASGDVIRLYDVNDPWLPELLSTTDAHWFDVIGLGLWVRRVEVKDKSGVGRIEVEPWIVSASLDQTIRKWRLAELVNPPKEPLKQETKEEIPKPVASNQLTAEEEAELAELMSDED
ncbi:WD40 domain containing protein [Pyrrhoderma noxium]|uniref:WD40 domain containing protein n=1 Tax=Pyrrhoderma noxium TaxID=2282107 RepID=A0A286UVC2_9AGAM|nr:WD40 domain containing protein [Pyrrhoderma noxium]